MKKTLLNVSSIRKLTRHDGLENEICFGNEF